MPYVIISTVALLSNLYKNAPLIVGDKDSDPDLMRFLGARITTNYPACGSPPMYVMHAPPRTVFDNLEKIGYCLMSAQTIQEHSVWILARPRVPDDDKVEISRGGPNDKSIQAFEDGDLSPSSRSSSPTKRGGTRTSTPTKVQPRVKVVSPTDSVKLKGLEKERETVTVTSKGDGIVDWLGSEKVHMRVQVSDSDVSVPIASSISARSSTVFEPKHAEPSSKLSFSPGKGNTTSAVSVDVNDVKIEPKTFMSRETQADLSLQTLAHANGRDVNRNGSGVEFYCSGEEAKKKFDVEKPLMLDSFTQVTKLEGNNSSQTGYPPPAMETSLTQLHTSTPTEPKSPAFKFREQKDTRFMKTSFIMTSCRGSPPIALLENPVFALADPTHLACLTHENCCCQENEE